MEFHLISLFSSLPEGEGQEAVSPTFSEVRPNVAMIASALRVWCGTGGPGGGLPAQLLSNRGGHVGRCQYWSCMEFHIT